MFAVKDVQRENQEFSFRTQKSDTDFGSVSRSGFDSGQLLQRSLGNDYLNAITPENQSCLQAITKIGGQRIQRACACGGACTGCGDKEDERQGIQTKLAISQPGDLYEREADRIADQVVRIPETSIEARNGHSNTGIGIQRVRASAGETSPSVPGMDFNFDGGQTLLDSVRAYMEPRFGYDFSGVRVHTDTAAAKTAQSVDAVAYTMGNHIVFNQGHYSPDTPTGKKLLAHELTHVIQQGSSPIHRKNALGLVGSADEHPITASSVGSTYSDRLITIQRQITVPWARPLPPITRPMPFEGVRPIPIPGEIVLPPFIPQPEVDISDPETEPELEQEPEVEPEPEPEPEAGPSPVPPVGPTPRTDDQDKDRNFCGSKRLPLTHVTFTPGPQGQAGTVLAQPLTRCPGNTTGTLADWRVYPEQFKCIKKSGLGRFWLPVHMLHGMTPRRIFRNLHGPGNDRRNIIIAHSSINRQMNAMVEEPALVRVYDLNQVLWYESKVDSYVPGAEFFTQSITVNYGLMDLSTGSRGPRYGGGTFTSSVPAPNCAVALGAPATPVPLLPKALADFNSTISICERILRSRIFPVKNGGLKVTLNASRPSGCSADDYNVSLEKSNRVFDDEISTTKIPANKSVTLTWKQLEPGDYYLICWVPNSAGPTCCLTGSISVFTFDVPRPVRLPYGRSDMA